MQSKDIAFAIWLLTRSKFASRFQVRIVSRETRANSLTVTFMCQIKKDNPHPVKIKMDSSP